MQARNRESRRVRRSKGDLLDQKWLTYLLVLILVALIGIFVVSLRYQDELVQYAKDFVQRAKEALSASLGLKATLGEYEYPGIVKRFAVAPIATSLKLCSFSPIESSPIFLSTLKLKSTAIE